jgi:UDP-N-acetyl-D-mannosaminuronic acid dehydrogenase
MPIVSATARPASVCIVGLGYIGLPTAGVLADAGMHVWGVDVRPDVVHTINQGRIHIHEPGLDRLIERVVRAGNLRAGSEPRPADVFVLCVPTPITADRRADLRYVEQAAESIRPHVPRGALIILESTSPPGTTEKIVGRHAIPPGWSIGRDVFVAHCPERVLPGRILVEVVENDRIVGGLTDACTARARDFYRSFVKGEVLTTRAVSAELTKLVENSYRDVNIAFANELSMLAGRFDVDAREIIELANRHPRVKILSPGPGVGGHCISVDPWFLIHAAPEETRLIRAARQVNDHKPKFVAQQITDEVDRHALRTIGCLGLTYKADVDDIRESPSLDIVRRLKTQISAELLVCDPYVSAERCPEFPLRHIDEVLERAELLVLLTDHQPFRELPAAALAGKRIIDTRGAWRRQLQELRSLADGRRSACGDQRAA